MIVNENIWFLRVSEPFCQVETLCGDDPSLLTHIYLEFFMACPYQFYIHHFFVTVNKKLEHRWQEKLILKTLKLNLQISRGVVIRNCKKGLTTNHICLQSHFTIITSKITRGMYILTRCVNWKNNRKRIRYLVDK